MNDAKLDEVSKLCEFWSWVLETKADLEARVKDAHDLDGSAQAKFEREIREAARTLGDSPADEEARIESFGNFWRATRPKEIKRAESELSRFLFGPVGCSQRGRIKFPNGLYGLVDARTCYTFRDAWEDRLRPYSIARAVEAITASYDYRNEDFGLLYDARIALAVLLTHELRGQEYSFRGLLERSNALVLKGLDAKLEKRAHDWRENYLKAAKAVAGVIGSTTTAVIKLCQLAE